jgi:hypothetical protein
MGEAGFVLPLGLHAEKLRRVVHDGFFRRLARGFPCRATEFVEIRRLAADADVFANEVGLFQWNSEQGTIAIL